jgi:hypothetical protein
VAANYFARFVGASFDNRRCKRLRCSLRIWRWTRRPEFCPTRRIWGGTKLGEVFFLCDCWFGLVWLGKLNSQADKTTLPARQENARKKLNSGSFVPGGHGKALRLQGDRDGDGSKLGEFSPKNRFPGFGDKTPSWVGAAGCDSH